MEALSKLGIDFVSIGLYLLNIGVLLVLLTWLLYKPLLKFLDERKNLIVGNINEADLLKSEFQKKLEEMRREKEEATEKIRIQAEQVQVSFTEKHNALLAEMETERERLLSEARAQIEEEKHTILKAAEEETIKTMQKVIFYVLQNKVPADVVESSVKDAWKEYTS
ncbi:MAG: ATP synthase F0 subunit B [Candidatus Gracilibacteria bacterium]